MSVVACGLLHAPSLADHTQAMALLRRNPAVLSALLVACAVAGCRSTHPLPSFESAGLRIEVAPAKKVKARKKVGNYVEVVVKIWNSHEGRIRFDLEQVRLLYGPDEVAPVNVKEQSLEVPAKSPREFTWRFETPELLEEGTYPVEIRKIMMGDSALGETARIEILVP